MGMDTQTVGTLQQGLTLAGDVMGMLGSSNAGVSTGVDGTTEEMARMTELDSREKAEAAKRRARDEARDIRATLEQGRANSTTQWGRSNLAMSGSKTLVRDGLRSAGRQKEEDALFDGQMEADEEMGKGMRNANLFRINNGISPSRSTLSQGSTIYKYGR